MTEEQKNAAEAPVFRMQKMYIKDLSFESPNAPGVFITQNQKPKIDFNLQLENKKLDDDHWEVTILCTAKVADENADNAVMFIVELEHAAVFLMKNIPEEHLQRVMAVDCPLMLFPFTRQVMSQVSVEGGFMPFLMEPINFPALYENAQQQKDQAEKQ